MKKFILLTAMCMMISTGMLSAQTFIGIRGGAGLTSMNFKDVDPQYNIGIFQNQRMGNVMGVVFKFMQDKHAALQIETNLTGKGWIQAIPIGFQYETQLRYANVNAFTHLALGKSKFRIYLLGGLFVNYLLSAEASEIPEDMEDEIPYIYDINEDNRWELGLGGGGGFVLNTNVGDFQIDGRLNMGLTNVLKEITDTDPTFSRSINVEVTLMYMYPFFKKKKDQ